MQAINKYIIVNEIKEEKKTQSGLLLTVDDQAEFRYKLGEVVNPGTNVEVIKSGDRIYYDKNAGHKVMIGDTVHTVILERDVVVVL